MTKRERFEFRTNALNRSLRATRDAGTLDALIAAMSGLTDWWDFNSDRITGTTTQSIANRVNGGDAMVEDGTYSGLVVGTTGLPRGGQMIACGTMDADTVLELGSFPNAANAVWTQVICFRMDESTTIENRTDYLWRGPAGGSQNHFMYCTSARVYAGVGSAGSYLAVDINQPMGAWTYAIRSWNNSTKVGKLAVGNTMIGDTDTGVAQNQNQTTHYIGGHPTSPSFRGRIGPALLFYGTSAAVGDLFDASRTADLAVIGRYCDAQIGRLSL